MYCYILLRFTPTSLDAGAVDVAACCHINAYLGSRRGRVTKAATRTCACLGILVLVLGKADEDIFVKALPQLILAMLGVAALYQGSPYSLSHDEYQRVAHAANALRPGAYKAPKWWRTLLKETLHVVEQEAMASYEALDLEQLLGVTIAAKNDGTCLASVVNVKV